MKKLGCISYEEFARLRFLDFFAKTRAYSIDVDGGFECPIGFADWEGYGPGVFFIGSPRSRRSGWQTCGINLDFENECPEGEAHALLDQLGFPLRRGMSNQEVKNRLGKPYKEHYAGWPEFILGKQWPYFVQCGINKQSGLFRIEILRKDLVDKNQERWREL